MHADFGEPTKLLDALMREARIDHNGSPVVRWCIGDVVGHYDRRGNIYPNKARVEAKIDCASAPIMARGTSIAAEAQPDDVIYKDHGLLVF